jgi:hypothetical protein
MWTPREESLWWQESTPCLQLIRALKEWLAHFQDPSWHSALEYQAARPYERARRYRHSSQLVAASQMLGMTTYRPLSDPKEAYLLVSTRGTAHTIKLS